MKPRRAMLALLEGLRPELEAAGMLNCSLVQLGKGSPDEKWRMRLDSRGLTPTLHARRFGIEIDLVDACGPPLEIHDDLDRQGELLRLETLTALRGDDVETATNLASSMLEHVLGVHARRADAAAMLSLPASGADLSDMAHVVMDEWSVARLRGIDEAGAREFARRAVSTLSNNDEGVISVLISDDQRFVDTQASLRWLDGRPLPMIVPAIEESPGVWFDGSTLLVPHLLPETALAAVEGRRLGDVVQTRTDLDDRIVEDGYVEGDDTCLVLVPRPVPATWN